MNSIFGAMAAISIAAPLMVAQFVSPPPAAAAQSEAAIRESCARVPFSKAQSDTFTREDLLKYLRDSGDKALRCSGYLVQEMERISADEVTGVDEYTAVIDKVIDQFQSVVTELEDRDGVIVKMELFLNQIDRQIEQVSRLPDADPDKQRQLESLASSKASITNELDRLRLIRDQLNERVTDLANGRFGLVLKIKTEAFESIAVEFKNYVDNLQDSVIAMREMSGSDSPDPN